MVLCFTIVRPLFSQFIVHEKGIIYLQLCQLTNERGVPQLKVLNLLFENMRYKHYYINNLSKVKGDLLRLEF